MRNREFGETMFATTSHIDNFTLVAGLVSAARRPRVGDFAYPKINGRQNERSNSATQSLNSWLAPFALILKVSLKFLLVTLYAHNTFTIRLHCNNRNSIV